AGLLRRAAARGARRRGRVHRRRAGPVDGGLDHLAGPVGPGPLPPVGRRRADVAGPPRHRGRAEELPRLPRLLRRDRAVVGQRHRRPRPGVRAAAAPRGAHPVPAGPRRTGRGGPRRARGAVRDAARRAVGAPPPPRPVLAGERRAHDVPAGQLRVRRSRRAHLRAVLRRPRGRGVPGVRGARRRGGPPMTSVGRAAVLSGVLIGAGTGLGFVRDLVMAHLFGADGSTDAFLVAWTIPETVSPLLIEDAMALLMVPVVTRMLARGDGPRPLVGTALPRLVLGLSAGTLALAAAAPLVVDVLAPGLTERGPAVECVRLTAVTVVTFGVAGFMSATLRAHHRFGPPAAIYLAYNVGILALIAGLSGLVGITSAAAGVACGSVLMIAVQAPAFVRCLRASPAAPPGGRGPDAELRVMLAAAAPIVVYTVTRQAQVFVERFLASDLAAGSISHLNYAQKVAQVPMVLSLLIVTVTFPRLARAMADGDTARVARRIRQDLAVASAMVLGAAAFLIAFAPAVIRLLFEHGEFTSADTSGTASILRV